MNRSRDVPSTYKDGHTNYHYKDEAAGLVVMQSRHQEKPNYKHCHYDQVYYHL